MKTSARLAVVFLSGFSACAQVTMRHHAPPVLSNYDPQVEALRRQTEAYARRAAEDAENKRRDAIEKALAQFREDWDKAVAKIEEERNNVLTNSNFAKETSIRPLEFRERQLQSRLAAIDAERTEVEAKIFKEIAQKSFEPKDPYRVLKGDKTYAKGKNWVLFTGKVLEVHSEGICLFGSFGLPFEDPCSEREFFVNNFPHNVADGEVITSEMKFVAFYDVSGPTYTYTNVYHTKRGGVHTIRQLEYGTPFVPTHEIAEKLRGPQEILLQTYRPDFEAEESQIHSNLAVIEVQITEAKVAYTSQVTEAELTYQQKLRALPGEFLQKFREKDEEKRRQMEAKTLQWHIDLAAKGDAYGQLRMGERYLNGEGVEVDEMKAKGYLRAAAAQGNDEAKKLLSALDNKSDSSATADDEVRDK